ncbi:MAG: hypothetical protein V4576_00815 [Patescibacteria group bacterium]
MEKDIHTKNNTKETIAGVLQKIQHKEISVHSKAFFRLRMFALIVLVVGICLTSILLCSFILFNIHMSGQPKFLEFGPQGIKLMFIVFPWVLFLIDIILIGLASALIRHVSFGYKIPGIYILLGAIGIIAISGYIVESHTPFHRVMLYRADRNQLPLFDGAYKRVRRPPPEGYGIYRGVIVLKENGVLHIDLDGINGIATTTTVTVKIPEMAGQEINIGDSVFIAGKKVDNSIVNARLRIAPRLPPPR